jgi:uncharacterized protein YjbI with pentapeptide repeats
MKPLALALIGLTVICAAAPAMAQNAGQIARARSGASCPGCNLFQADFANLTLKSKNFSRARLRQADMSASIMNRTSFAGADLRDVNGFGGVFSSANFRGANLTNATFVGAYLQGADFSRAILSGTNFSGAEMGRARGLTQHQLNAACGDDTTQLPPGLSVHACR